MAHNEQRIVVADGTFQASSHYPQQGSGYFTIRNDDGNDHLLKGITSPVCTTVMAHHTDQEQTPGANDLFNHLALPPNSTMIFPPAGYHLLCEGVTSMPPTGSHVPFTFHFLKGSDITVSFTVTAPDPNSFD
ncbi:hypothetical protein GMO_12310 [Gluconobacter morbifer G707]|uniref:Copper chaperone PCu(A)C n=1 Tax=Gluconobacter morbifer G707 TaxID=1088869 RepID=G6XI21_9PROT|nr:hypothetical protein GMO_12310 [Gluconobacter morbifer G707]